MHHFSRAGKALICSDQGEGEGDLPSPAHRNFWCGPTSYYPGSEGGWSSTI